MTIKDIIKEIGVRVIYLNEYLERESQEVHKKILRNRICELEGLEKWIKSNLEEGYEKYGKDFDDWRESKIAEEREG